MENDYECPRCHNVFPFQNKILHDIRCTEANPMVLNQSNQIQINNQKIQNPLLNNLNNSENNQKNSEFQIPQKPLESNNFPSIFTCNLCGEILPESAKNDHILCHNLEQKQKDLINNKNILEANEREIEQQKIIEEQIKKKNKMKLIEQQKKIENQIKKENEKKRIEKEKKMKKMIEQQRRIEQQIKTREMRRQIHNQQNQMRRYNNLNRNNFNGNMDFFQPVKPNYDHPTDQTILDELPENIIDDVSKLDAEKKSCLICLEDFKIRDKTTILPCIHFFHTNCIKNWLKSQNSCPICKFKLINSNINQ